MACTFFIQTVCLQRIFYFDQGNRHADFAGNLVFRQSSRLIGAGLLKAYCTYFEYKTTEFFSEPPVNRFDQIGPRTLEGPALTSNYKILGLLHKDYIMTILKIIKLLLLLFSTDQHGITELLPYIRI